VVIVDTTVWIDYLRGTMTPEVIWLDRELTCQRLGLTDLILCEVLQGIPEDDLFLETRDELMNFHIFESTREIAIASATNYRVLRANGYTVRKTVDCLIATFCIETGHGLLHRDRDFDIFEKKLGLRVIHP
jgi:predicted nucleic acid-binding protein